MESRSIAKMKLLRAVRGTVYLGSEADAFQCPLLYLRDIHYFTHQQREGAVFTDEQTGKLDFSYIDLVVW